MMTSIEREETYHLLFNETNAGRKKRGMIETQSSDIFRL